MRIAIASGKGGTGKTLISTNLARWWADQGHSVTYVDADAEEPNGHLFLHPEITTEARFSVKVPTLGERTCEAHGKCQEICAFNAILSAKGRVIVFNELCHSCGACILACPESALRETDREIGTISVGDSAGISFVSGRLDVGEARVTPLIEDVVDQSKNDSGIIVIDAPPGTSCAAMAAVFSADLLLLVTEPTPFGQHDLALAVGMGRKLNLPLAAVINRADIGDHQTKDYLHSEGIPLLAEFPFDRLVAEAYAASKLPVNECTGFKRSIATIGEWLLARRGESK